MPRSTVILWRPGLYREYAPDFFSPRAKYTDYGTAQLVMLDALKAPPISDYGNMREIAALFGGFEQLREAVDQLQTLLYAA